MNRVVRRIFGSKIDLVIGGRIKLHNVHSSPSMKNEVKEYENSRACSTNGERNNAYELLVGTSLGRPRRRLVDNINKDLG
jgi:hypothetical protein